MAELRSDLENIDGRPYGFYKDLRGRSYALGAYELTFEHIQADPFAAPSRIRVDIPDASRGKKAERVRSVKTRAIEFGTEEIEVSLLSQLVDAAQCRMIADVLLECTRGLCDGRRSFTEILDLVDTRIDAEGLETVTQPSFGDRARARRVEIAAALNRLRSLRLIR